jgi:hypothetical protein
MGATEVLLIGVRAQFVGYPLGIDAGPRVPTGGAGGKREDDTVRNRSHTLTEAGASLSPLGATLSARLQFVVDRVQAGSLDEHHDVIAGFDDGVTTGDNQFAVAADGPNDHTGRQFLHRFLNRPPRQNAVG